MNLKNISDKSLLNETFSLASKEREILSKLLWHLKEVDRRKLYSDLKCGSLFEYCIRVLKYSEGQASRRVSAARLLKDLPEIAPMIESGELNLMQLNHAKQFFNDEGISEKKDKIKLLTEISGKSLSQTQEELNKKRKQKQVDQINIKITKETFEALKEIQALRAHSYPSLDLVIHNMCREIKTLWDPTIIKRRGPITESSTRYVPTQVKAEVWIRDKGKCTNCNSIYALEFDHIHPFAKGGITSTENMQLLCRNCNQRKGLVEFKNYGKTRSF